MQIKIKVQKNAIINFKLDVCGFYDSPTDIQMLNGQGSCLNGLAVKDFISEDYYDIYLYDF